MNDRLNAEAEATQGLLKLIEQAKACRVLYERAHMALPETLKRVLGISESDAGQEDGAAHIPAPQAPPRPPEAEADWIWIKAADASATSVVLAVLRSAKGPMRAKEVNASVTAILPNAFAGSIANIGNRLDGEVIQRTKEGWKLLKPEKAPVLQDGFVWGQRSIFAKQELAAHRRDAILHILSFFPTGLQTVQIVEQLKMCSWVKAPVNKDLLKEDMEVLQPEKVRRRGNSKKWELVGKEGT